MSSNSAAPDRKRMRKGTRACQECRRRKIKCKYDSDTTVACINCSENGRPCTQQGTASSVATTTKVVKSSRLMVRVTRLESVIERLARSSSTPRQDKLSDLDSKAAPSLEGHESERKRKANPALFALFRNEVLLPKTELVLPHSVEQTISLTSPELKSRDFLLSTIIHETSLLAILSSSSSWYPPFQSHYTSLPPSLLNLNLHLPLPSFVTTNLSSLSLISVSIALLAIATSLQTLRPGVDDQKLYLSAPREEVLGRITASVDQIVLQDHDGNGGYGNEGCEGEGLMCKKGVVLLVLRGKLHAESNQVRKAWLCIQRACVVAKRLGENGRWNVGQEKGRVGGEVRGKNSEVEAWSRLVDGLIETDRFFSMFLGMPCVPDLAFENNQDQVREQWKDARSTDEKMRYLRRITAIACGEINGRNATGQEEVAISRTEDIQTVLDSAVVAMPKEWWDVNAHLATMIHPWDTFEHLNTQFWFFQTQAFLQLPHMLLATSHPEFSQNGEICLNSCRNLVSLWILLRASPVFEIYLCKLDDFQALIAGIVILVGMLQSANEEEGMSYVTDLRLLEDVMGMMRVFRTEQNGAIARQGLRVLEELGGFLPGAEGGFYDEPERKKSTTLFIPYFGAVSVEVRPHHPSTTEGDPGEDFPKMPPDSQLDLEDETFGAGKDQWDRSSEPEDSNEYFNFNGLTYGTDFEWEKLMLGTELDQDWDWDQIVGD